MNNHQYILTIAGLDPSSGAGLTSDLKTFDAHGLYGLSVCTAITVQNDIDFKHCVWTDEEIILAQIACLLDRFSINTVKIGIVPSWKIALSIVILLKKHNPEITIVLDPVLKATAGFTFHSNDDYSVFEQVISHCSYITPNYEELKAIFPDKNIDQTIEALAELTNVYVKGGHRLDKPGWDELYYNKIVKMNIPPAVDNVYQKHGSGCVLSSALAANLALSIPMEDACKNAKYYTEQFLNSNKTLLGTHSFKARKND
ncbi:hydroxymethylpyrimidine/phosphomethylpyrimidine kinase [Tenacibaculum geojense]|uniref:hydroxymethylpyrimidine kinase n=1 Tax=Tenacibaculum geojense TaxID=915352 RepID=A0ABW3JRQ5_9FLAO